MAMCTSQTRSFLGDGEVLFFLLVRQQHTRTKLAFSGKESRNKEVKIKYIQRIESNLGNICGFFFYLNEDVEIGSDNETNLTSVCLSVSIFIPTRSTEFLGQMFFVFVIF